MLKEWLYLEGLGDVGLLKCSFVEGSVSLVQEEWETQSNQRNGRKGSTSGESNFSPESKSTQIATNDPLETHSCALSRWRSQTAKGSSFNTEGHKLKRCRA